MNTAERALQAPTCILLAIRRPLLRRGLLNWLSERYPQIALRTIEETGELQGALRTHRPQLLLIEPALLARAQIPPEQLPRILLLSPALHTVLDRPPTQASACAQICDGADEPELERALERALACPRPCALHCASDACELRVGDRPAALGLSGRELEVFCRLGAGEPPREIAAALGLSVKTVEHYRAQIKDKLALRDSRELLEFAVLWRRGLAARPSQLHGL